MNNEFIMENYNKNSCANELFNYENRENSIKGKLIVMDSDISINTDKKYQENLKRIITNIRKN